jgi:hypothetical protein
VRLAVAAAAVLALGAGVRLWLDSQAGTLRGLAAKAEFVAPPKREAVERPPSASFAVVLPSTGNATHSVMMARFNGKLVICARPKATESDEFWPTPRAMVGWVSLD